MVNPLDADVEITNSQVILQGKDSSLPAPRAEVERIDEVVLKAKDSQTVRGIWSQQSVH